MKIIFTVVFFVLIAIPLICINKRLDAIDNRNTEFLDLAQKSVNLTDSILSDFNKLGEETTRLRHDNIELIKNHTIIMEENRRLKNELIKSRTKLGIDCTKFQEGVEKIAEELKK